MIVEAAKLICLWFFVGLISVVSMQLMFRPVPARIKPLIKW